LFLDAASRLTDTRLMGLAALALVYASMREIEAYALWHQRRWAEWFALVSGAVYLPVEIYELTHGLSWMKVLALAINLVVVAVMGYAVWQHAPEQNGLASS
jgi:uncharacterized membrane protein (DUF2068 family)